MTEDFVTIGTGRVLWQFGMATTPAWWFESEGSVGICRLDSDPLTAFRSIVGPDTRDVMVSVDFVADRRLRRLSPPRPWRIEDHDDGPDGAETEMMVPVGSDGVRYPLADGFEILVFGPPGERSGWRRGPAIQLGRRFMTEAAEAGAVVAPIPTRVQLRVIDE